MVKRRWAKTAFWSLFATIVVTLALLLTAARALFPYVDDYRQEIEAWASEQFGQALSIGELDARWRYTYPEVIFRQVSLLDDQGEVLSTLPELILRLDVAELLFNQQISFAHLSLALDKLTLQRDPQGKITLLEFQAPTTSDPDESENTDQLLEWLLKQGSLNIRVADLAWIDQAAALDYHFQDVDFSLNNDGNHHQLSGMIQLPFAMGATLELAIDMVGNPLHDTDWQGQAYLSGQSISLAHWLLEQPFYGQQVIDGHLDFTLWSEWKNGVLNSLQGELALENVALASTEGGESRHFEDFNTQLEWQRTEGGWQIALNELMLSYQQHRWSPANHVLRIEAGDERRLALQSDYLHLADIDDFVNYLGLLSSENQAILTTLQPQGELVNVEVQYPETGQYHIAAGLRKLSLSPWEQLPGVKQASGQLLIQPEWGRLQLDITEGAVFEWPKLFRDPVSIEQLQGEFSWSQQGDTWSLNSNGFSLSNQHLSLEGAINLLLPADESPFLDLALDFKRGNLAYTSRYLPILLLPDSVISWLDQGIVAGELLDGGMIYHGALNDFPFSDASGQFEVSFNVTDGHIVPYKGWLPISDIDASVSFQGADMLIEAKQGAALNSHIQQCRVAIDGLGADNNSLSISGDMLAESPDIFEYLLNSPVAGSVDFLSIFQAHGKSQVALALEIPLSSDGVFSFDATGQLTDNGLDILPADLSLKRLNGTLHVSMAGLEIEQINGLLYGEPIEISAKILDQIPGGATQIQAITSLSGEMLSQHFDLSLFSSLMSGTGSLSAEVFLPYHPALAQRVSSVQLESTLEGVALALPGTLGKQPEEQRKVAVELQLSEERPVLAKINYDGGVSALLSFEQPRLRGEVLLGEAQPLQLPEQPGLTISGELSEFSLSELLTLLPKPPKQSADEPGLLHGLNLSVAELELFGQQWQSVKLTATRTDWQWLINIDSPQAKGRIQLSEQGPRERVIADMAHLHLSKQADAEASDDSDSDAATPLPFDMRKLPPLHIQVQQFSYDNVQLGAMTLNSHWADSRYQLEELLLHPDSAKLSLQGHWDPDPSPLGESNMNLWLDSNNIGRTISGLGYAGTIKNGEGSVNAAIQWPGGFGEFGVENINGKIEFKFEDGQILDVEPGAGRILGLLSLQMLPRRLLFDFSDLFGKGFSFDEIRGHYEMDSGIAKTDNLTMLGASARVDMLGTVDLGKREYDQRLIVTPFVTGTLPMLTYLTGVATPQIAAVIFLAQKVFQDDLEKMAQFEYHVSGPWDNPNVVKVGEEKPVAQE